LTQKSTMRIDAHHHLWHYSPAEYPWIDDAKREIARDYMPDDLRLEMSANQIDGVVSVQARQSLEETDALLDLAAQFDWIRGVVGWIPLRDANVDDVLARYASEPKLRAVRHVVQDEPDDRFLVGSDFMRGISKLAAHDLVYDLLILPHQLPAAIELVDRFPNQPFVLDHIAKPRIRMHAMDEVWRASFVELAKREHVACKFSGIITEVRDATWTVETMRPYWDIALHYFGADRLMFGTDWPVCTLRGTYSHWTSAVEELAAELSDDEQKNFWGSTAERAYGLP